MKTEIRIDLKALLGWGIRKWKVMIPGAVIAGAIMIGLLYFNEIIAYRHETSKFYPMSVCLERLNDSEMREVKLTLAMERLMRQKEDELEILRLLEEPTAEEFIHMENLLEEIDSLRSLSIGYRYAFNRYQERYYDLLNGADENDMGREYPTVTKRMIFSGIIIGIIAVITLLVLLYLLSGYLHSEDEIRINYGYRVNTVNARADSCTGEIDLLLQSEKWNKEDPIAVIGLLDAEKNRLIAEQIEKATKGRLFLNCLNDAESMAQIKKMHQVMIAAKVNETKLKDLEKLHDSMAAMETNVIGVLLITE